MLQEIRLRLQNNGQLDGYNNKTWHASFWTVQFFTVKDFVSGFSLIDQNAIWPIAMIVCIKQINAFFKHFMARKLRFNFKMLDKTRETLYIKSPLQVSYYGLKIIPFLVSTSLWLTVFYVKICQYVFDIFTDISVWCIVPGEWCHYPVLCLHCDGSYIRIAENILFMCSCVE